MRRKYFIQILLSMGVLWRPMLYSSNLWKKGVGCKTGSDVQGPFYRKGAPLRSKLYDENLFQGKSIVVSGKVFDSDCETVVKNAILDLWHANPKGEYDSFSDKYNFRGQVITNENGEYTFETLKPAPYTDGGLNRPAHIHYKVRAEGYKELTTQLYFPGDERLKNDFFVKLNNGMERVCSITESDGVSKINFDIYL